jgi:hypothetical protein
MNPPIPPPKVRDLWDYFQIIGPFIVALVAIIVGFKDQILDLVQRRRFEIYPGDAVRFVKSADGSFAGLHLMCNLVNKTTKVGTLHRLEVRVSGPQNIDFNFAWNLVYAYSPGGQEVYKEADPYPVAVLPKDSKLVLGGFRTEPEQECKWLEGEYEFKVLGWVNSKSHLEPNNLESTFHIRMTKDDIYKLSQPNQFERPIFHTVPVIEWERRHA